METFEGSKNPPEEKGKKERPKAAKKIVTLYSEDLAKLIVEEALREQELKSREVEENKQKTELETFVQEIANEQTENEVAKRVGELIRISPSQYHIDILFRFNPNLKGMKPDFVKKIMAEWLGDFLMIRRDWKAEDIETLRDIIDTKDIEQTYLYLLTNDCLAFINKGRKDNHEIDETVLFEQYFEREETAKLVASNIPEVKNVVQRLREYYADIFRLREKKPSNIVTSLKEGRVFPDINQLLNIKEMKEKKKMLIADEMGLGKSASAILTKEYLGLKRALVVMPSNVEGTWNDYLSDLVGENGKQIGYFQKGLAPKTLIINSPEDIERLKTEVFDYVLISQEKMNDRYTEGLAQINFDMLIVDEVHKMKNIKRGIRSENLVKLAKKIQGDNSYLALLSGTPAPDKVQDIAISLKLLYPEKYEKFSNTEIVRRIIEGDLIDLRAELLMRMQMKELTSSIEMPTHTSVDVEVELSPTEREIYEILLEEGESTASEKIIMFREFLLNPELLDVEPGFIGSKTKVLEETLNEDLKTQDKIIVFVNGYIKDVITGDRNIIKKMQLPADVVIEEIHGDINSEDRKRIQDELKMENRKMIVFVSGQTANVGVDFSGADGVIHYNEPWSKYEKRQMDSRVYREGVKHDIVSKTLMTKNTIEEGMRVYTNAKEKAIEKLLRGIQNTDWEKKLLTKDSKSDDTNIETNAELSRVYLSKWDKMMVHFGENQFIGEEKFKKNLPEKGHEYAELYREIGPLSYQGNNARATATVLEKMIEERKELVENLRILDIASGPEMLKEAATEKLKNRIFSSDLNANNFDESPEKRKTLIASYLNLPAKDNSIDYCNYAFAFHQTPNIKYYKKNYERLQVLAEMNRVLKLGGRAVISMLNDFPMVNKLLFSTLLENLGFKVVPEYSGHTSGGESYKADFWTLEKVGDIPEYKSDTEKYVKLGSPRDILPLGDRLGRELLEGLEIEKVSKNGLRDQRRMIDTVTIGDKEIKIIFNEKTGELYNQEVEAIRDGEVLREKYKGIKNIPLEEIKKVGYERKMRTPGYYLLYKIIKNGGAVIIRGDYKKKKSTGAVLA